MNAPSTSSGLSALLAERDGLQRLIDFFIAQQVAARDSAINQPTTPACEGATSLASPAEANGEGPTLYDDFKDLIGCIKDAPEDLSREHAHYASGAPKRGGR